MSAHKADILVVDDTPAYLEALRDMLSAQGYKVRPVTNGKLALGAAQHQRPDLILLDINMPVLDGFQTCERLKSDPALADIPVIFLSSLTETEDKVKAFSAGGVDYVTKPFQAAEVLARVETHLRLRKLQQQLAAQFEDLKKLEGMRDSLTHMIVHDLRSPLQSILGNLELFALDPNLSADARTDLGGALRSTHTLIHMISALLDVNKLEAGEMPLRLASADLAAPVKDALDGLTGLTKERTIAVEKPDGAVLASFDREVIARVVSNLVANALKFSPAQGTVTVRVRRRDGKAAIEVIDAGPGIPPEYRTRIFEKFGQVESGRKQHSTGLGLAFCKLAVDAHAGEIGVDSEVGRGSTFWFALPLV